MRKIILISIMLSFTILLLGTPIGFGMRIDRGVIENNELNEISGLVLSNQNESVFWTHNDSGGETTIYAFGANGEHLGKFYLEGITFRDVEDISVLDHDGDYLLIADVGDNGGNNDQIYVYKVLEPQVTAGQAPVLETIPASDIETFTYEYPNGNHFDSETIFSDNSTGDIYLVTKRGPDNPYSDEYDHVFKSAYPQSSSSVNSLIEVAQIDVPLYMNYGLTAGDCSHSGREILMKTYDAVYYWEVEIGESISDALDDQPIQVYYELEPQGEAICWGYNANGYYTSSEENGGYPARLSYYPRLTSYIQINQLPTGLYKPNEEIQIGWGPEGLNNQLYLSDSPEGGVLENYDATGIWGEDQIITNPIELGLSVGVYRGILHNPDYDYVSMEFPLIIESENATQMIYPPNGGTITEGFPEFQWAVNPGVPYYLIAVSDTPFIIEHDENGDAIVAGIATVWQALTYDTSLMYGMPDPSGYFENTAPPLIPNQEYNWIVVNNYGNDALLSSKVVGSPFAFYYSTEEEIDPPELLTPTDNSTLNSAEINFSWTEVEEAMYYQVQIFEDREQGSNTGSFLIWDNITTNNDIDMNAQGILIDSEYSWKVYATTADGISSVSETQHFNYDIAVGILNLHIRDIYGSPVPFATAEIDPIDGSSDNFPLGVNSNGNEEKTLPVGQYIVEVTKDGFEPNEAEFTIYEDEDTSVTVQMTSSESSFYGQVVDTSGFLLNNTTIVATNNSGDQYTTDGTNGNYNISVTPGLWTITAQKSGWQLMVNQIQEIEAGETISLDPIVMIESTKDIQGNVINTYGNPVSAANVYAVSADHTYQSITNQNGSFTFSGVVYGFYEINAVKPGYTALNDLEINITSASPEVTSIEDIIFQPSSLINGTVTNGVVGVKDVVITAIPSMGTSITTMTNEYGDYSLNLLAGNYSVTAFKANFTSQNNFQINLPTGETLDNLDFTILPNDAVVSGNVICQGSGLAGVQITAGENVVLTNSAGYYELQVYPETYTLTAFKQGYSVNTTYTVSLGPGEELENVDYQLFANASVISGHTESNGTNVGSAVIYAEKQNSTNDLFTTTSTAQGNYSFSFGHGSYKIWASKQNFVCMPEDTLYIAIAPGEQISNIDIDLAPMEAYITGRIKNLQGNGIRGAQITAISGNLTYNTISGNLGNFNIIVEPQHNYNLTASKTGYSINTGETGYLDISEETYIELVLQQLPSTISGRIYSETGTALSGATITAEGDNSYSTTSSTNGNWQINIYAGEYSVSATKPGYLEGMEEVTIVPGSQVDSLDYYLAENFAILEGYAINANTGEPLEGVLITANLASGGGSSGYSDEWGEYHLQRMIPGLYNTIRFSKAGYYAETFYNQILPGSYNSVIDVMLQPFAAALEAQVTSGGSPLSSATISAENQINGNVVYATTNEDGYCSISEIESQMEYIVSVSKVNYTSDSEVLYFELGDTLSVSFDVTWINGEISGFIYDQDGNPVTSAEVTAASEDGYYSETLSSFNGSYLLENLAGDRNYTLNASKQGFSQIDETIVFLADVPLEQDLTVFAHNFEANGTLIDQAGVALNGIRVFCSGGSSSDQDFSEEDGSFNLTGLAPFTIYSFGTMASENGYENISWQDSLGNSNLNLEEITVPVHISRFLGTITDSETQEPLTGVTITAVNTDLNRTYGAISQPNGTYRIRYLYEGNYNLEFSKQNYNTYVMEDVNLAHREILTQDVSMEYNQPVEISGVVIDSNARTYSDVAVQLFGEGYSVIDTTDVNGEFMFSEVAPYSELILTTNLPAINYDNSWEEITTQTVNIASISLEIDVHSAEVSGEVTSDGASITNAQITLSNQDFLLSMITEADGEYNFSSLYEGTYDLSCYCPGYGSISSTITIADDDILEENIELVMLTDAISGIVFSEQEPSLKNAVVEIWQDDIMVAMDTTGAAGGFQFEGLATLDEFELIVNKLGYQQYIHSELVSPGQSLNIILSGIVNSLSGTVYHNNMENPEAVVYIRNLDGDIQETECNQFGDYLFTNLNGYFDIWAESGENLITISSSVIVNAGSSSRHYLSLIEAAEITGRMIYGGSPKPGVTITCTNIATGNWVQDLTQQDGEYRLRGLTAGTYDLEYFCSGYSFIDPPQEAVIETGEIVELPDIEMTFIQNAVSGIVQRDQERYGISGALLTLMDAMMNPINSFETEADGTFLFSPLEDGVYYVSVDHNAYYEVDDIEVTLSNGVSTPQTVEFNLEHKELFIYGYVYTDNDTPVEGAIVTAELNSGRDGLNNFAASTLSKTLERSIADTTDSDGYYEIMADTIGVWNLFAESETCYPSNDVDVELTWEQDWYQQDFYLQAIILYADISGTAKIFDGTWQALDSYEIHLLSQNGIDLTHSVNTPDSLFAFEDIIIPDVFSLEISGMYQGRQYHDFVDNIAINQEMVYEQNFEFTYVPDTWDVYGNVYMKDYDLLGIEDAEVSLIDSTGQVLMEYTTPDGYYQFSNIATGIYEYQINATYNEEQFVYIIEFLEISDNMEIDYYFQYFLCELGIQVVDNNARGLSNAMIRITGNGIDLNLLTDFNGNCSTGSILHTGDYQVQVSSVEKDTVKYLATENREIELASLGYYSHQIELPFWYYPDDYIGIYNYDEDINVMLYGESQFNVTLNYLNTNGNSFELDMTEDNGIYSAVIPAQNSQGSVSFWFEANEIAGNEFFSNSDSPQLIDLASEGIPSEDYSQIFPTNPYIPYGSEIDFSLTIKDELGNDLSELLEAEAQIEWSISNELAGSISTDPQEPLKVQFMADNSEMFEMETQLIADIAYLDFYIQCATTVITGDYYIAEINISGNSEISNATTAYYDLNIFSEQGRELTVSCESLDIGEYCGTVTFDGTIIYQPDPNFIGYAEIHARVRDPQTAETFDANKKVTIYQKVNSGTPEKTLTTGLACEVDLYDAMIANSQNQAKLYILEQSVPPYEEVDIEYETRSRVFKASSDLSESAWNTLPGMRFTSSEENLIFAQWNNRKLTWEILSEDSPEIDHIPNLGKEYAALSISDELGIYDLKLLPNPFTPHDVIGNNPGLQISFRLSSCKSRYVKISANVYTINGEHVRTITETQVMQKGEYLAGENETLYWDGYTDNGKLARNGRYFLQLIAEDSDSKEEVLKSIVLIK